VTRAIDIRIAGMYLYIHNNQSDKAMKKIVLISVILMFGGIFQAMAQDRLVMGTIRMMDNSPMYMVSVVLKGTTIGTTSGKNGKYLLKIPPFYSKYKTLCFSSVGMKSKELEIPVQENEPLNVHLEADIIPLEAVTIIYDTQTRQSWTYYTTLGPIATMDFQDYLKDSLQALDRLNSLR
jgi:hypothetical protein